MSNLRFAKLETKVTFGALGLEAKKMLVEKRLFMEPESCL